MRYLASGITAAELWHSSDTRLMPEMQEYASPQNLTDFWQTSHSNSSFGEADAELLEGLAQPPCLLAAEKRQIHGRTCIDSHTWGDLTLLPEGSIRRGKGDVLVASPELTLATLGRTHTPLELGLFASELCGLYTLPKDSKEGIIQCKPCTSKAQIAQFVEEMQGRDGIKTLRKALDWTVDRAASPREVQLALLLGASSHRRGFGLPMPELNKDVPLAGAARRFTSRSFYSCDLYWPEYDVALEYQSDRYHKNRQLTDAVKFNALQAMGISLVTVTWSQLRSFAEMCKVANVLRELMGIRYRKPREGAVQRREALHQRLVFGPTLFDPSDEAEMDTWLNSER